jgi:hypothetical protein
MRTSKKQLSLVPLLCLAFVGVSHSAFGTTVEFKTAVKYPAGTTPLAVATGDFNGDGAMDLAVATYGNPFLLDDGGVSILLGNGDGTFQPAIHVAAGKNPAAIVVGDFNGDTRADVALANTGRATVTVLLGNGNGSFQAAVDYDTGTRPIVVAIAAADLNGDQKRDLVVASVPDFSISNTGFGGASVLLGNGDGTFQRHVDYVTGENRDTAVDPRAVAVADLNGDGRADLALGGRFDDGSIGPVGILVGNGDGTFQAPIVGHSTHGVPGLAIAFGDFNDDDRLDLVVRFVHAGNGTASDVALLLGKGDGTLSQANVINTQTTGCHAGSPFSADFDGDGKLDIAVIGGGGPHDGVCLFVGAGTILVFKGNGDGTVQAPISLATTNAWDLGAAVDLNDDKAPDLITVNGVIGNSDDSISVLLNAAGADFSISASDPTPGTVSRGQSSTSTVTLKLLNTFDSSVALTCSVLPAQSAPTCSFNPNSVTFDANGNATATLTISTGAPTASLAPASLHACPLHFLWLPVAGFALMGAGFGSSRSTRRRLTIFLLGGILFGGLSFQAACGGASGGSGTTAYTIMATGTSGSTQHSTTTTLRVQ